MLLILLHYCTPLILQGRLLLLLPLKVRMCSLYQPRGVKLVMGACSRAPIALLDLLPTNTGVEAAYSCELACFVHVV